MWVEEIVVADFACFGDSSKRQHLEGNNSKRSDCMFLRARDGTDMDIVYVDFASDCVDLDNTST